MANKNLHEKPFDEATLLKLEIFEQYLTAWLPTFLYSNFDGEIKIWDFFAGQGYDIDGSEGSPIRILQIIETFKEDIIRSRKRITIILNELNQEKYLKLCEYVDGYFGQIQQVDKFIQIEIKNKKFDILFNDSKNRLKKGNNLIFIDQNGVKEVTESIFIELSQLPKTDFLFFVSSSYFKRFGDEFKKLHPKLNLEQIKRTKYDEIHLQIHGLFKNYAQNLGVDMFLFPFSIKKQLEKGYNIYGLIFGALHIAAAVKFLEIVWKKNPINGMANYDIDGDLKANQIDLFTGVKQITKIEQFQNALQLNILNGELKSNLDVFLYTYRSGHISSHAKEVVENLKKNKILSFTGPCLISYDAFRNNKKIIYEIL